MAILKYGHFCSKDTREREKKMGIAKKILSAKGNKEVKAETKIGTVKWTDALSAFTAWRKSVKAGTIVFVPAEVRNGIPHPPEFAILFAGNPGKGEMIVK